MALPHEIHPAFLSAHIKNSRDKSEQSGQPAVIGFELSRLFREKSGQSSQPHPSASTSSGVFCARSSFFLPPITSRCKILKLFHGANSGCFFRYALVTINRETCIKQGKFVLANCS